VFRSLIDLTIHYKIRAGDNHATPVNVKNLNYSNYKTIQTLVMLMGIVILSNMIHKYYFFTSNSLSFSFATILFWLIVYFSFFFLNLRQFLLMGKTTWVSNPICYYTSSSLNVSLITN